MNGRLGYIDALRGFSMLLVVFAHVMLSAGVGDNHTVLSTALKTFRMPLFFFVSGFFASRMHGEWTTQKVRLTLRRKVCAQIIGMLVFLGIYCYCHNLSLFTAKGWGFGGYWFTLSLFQMYVVYLAFSLVLKKYGNTAYFAAAVLLYVSVGKNIAAPPVEGYLFVNNTVTYMPYFALGILARNYREQFTSLIRHQFFATAAIVLFTVGLLLIYDRGLLEASRWAYLLNRNVVVRVAGLASVFILFHSLRYRLDGESLLARALRYTGRHTLEIYYLHYLLVPKLGELSPFLRTEGKTIVIIILLGTVTVAVTAVALLLGRWLRCSIPLARILFGEK